MIANLSAESYAKAPAKEEALAKVDYELRIILNSALHSIKNHL